MNVADLLEQYQNNNQLKQLAAGLSLPKPLITAQLKGINGSAISFIANSVLKIAETNHVFVLDDKESAAYFQNDLAGLSESSDICFFPDSFKKTGNFHQLNSSHIMLRTEALSKWEGKGNKKVMVTYPEALLEKVVDNHFFANKRVLIKAGETLDIDGLLKRLENLGFSKEDFVYEPGQIAIRGGILDIYSYGNEHPFRIELFGNEVDSIRIFNPETQL